ncbi:MAG: GerMN domain-containing protein [Limnothrix sp. BL-A-16]
MSDRPRRNLPISLVAAVGSTAVAVGAGVAWWNASTAPTPTPSPSAATTIPSPSPSVAASVAPTPPPSAVPQSPKATPAPAATAPIAEQSQVYWLKDTGTHFVMAGQPAKTVASSEPDEVLRGAIEQVLAGQPTDNNLSSAIPTNTKLLDVMIAPEGVRVNLSSEFTSGGGSASMMGRLGQIVYTASTLNPAAKVWILVEGQPLTVLGGEGLEVPQPIDRATFDRQFKP